MSDHESSGKGRPTRTRAEAEAARRLKAKLPRDSKEARKAMRQRSASERARQREALYSGDERFLPARDQGPIRKRIRNYVDARLSSGEGFLPIAFLVMIAFFFNNPTVNVVVNGIWTIMLLLVLVDAVVLSILLRRLMKREFPESVRRASHIGYGVTRALTMRWMRLPRPQVRIGGAPKEPRR
jgi:Flp pilus assembly protein TadB